MGSKFIPFFPLDLNGGEDPVVVLPALVEWVFIIDLLGKEKHGLDGLEIAEVEAFCWYATLDFQTADFVARTHDGRRFHLQGSMDSDAGPDMTAISVVRMPDDQRLPHPRKDNDPSTQWCTDTDPFNRQLVELRALHAPASADA